MSYRLTRFHEILVKGHLQKDIVRVSCNSSLGFSIKWMFGCPNIYMYMKYILALSMQPYYNCKSDIDISSGDKYLCYIDVTMTHAS